MFEKFQKTEKRLTVTVKERDSLKLKSIVLINKAKGGGIIDEAELIQALNSGKVTAAGIDVFKNEPTPSAALLAHEKISLTPHIGAATLEAQDRIGEELAEFIQANFPLS